MISLPLPGVGAPGASARDALPPPGGQTSTTAVTPEPSRQPAVQACPPPALATAAATQGGLAPLLADLAAAVSGGALPPSAQAAAERVLEFGLDVATPPSADELQGITARSGLFLEADLASDATAPGDFKATLLDLAQALAPAVGDARAVAARNPPPPPFAGGQVRGQPAAAGAPASGMAAEALAARLLGETRAALSRQTLMQSESTRGPDKPAASATTRWLFELPVADGGQRAVAQFEIARDGRRNGDVDERPAARARFSLDLAGLGPVHASVTLTGERVHVALWAEDGNTSEDLAAHRDELRATLQDEGLAAEVMVRDGAPPAPSAPSGHFMDTGA